MPTIPVVHHLILQEARQELLDQLRKRADRPEHRETRGMNYGALEKVYPDAFFSSAVQEELVYSLAELVTREYVIQKFAEKGIVAQNISFSKPASDVLRGPRFFQQDEWYALVEEARPLIPNLASLLGAV